MYSTPPTCTVTFSIGKGVESAKLGLSAKFHAQLVGVAALQVPKTHEGNHPLRAILPVSVLRQCIYTLHYLDAKPDFVADFCLPSPAASSQPFRLPNGRWELGTSM